MTLRPNACKSRRQMAAETRPGPNPWNDPNVDHVPHSLDDELPFLPNSILPLPRHTYYVLEADRRLDEILGRLRPYDAGPNCRYLPSVEFPFVSVDTYSSRVSLLQPFSHVSHDCG